MAANQIIPMLWFDSEAEEAARLYTALFPNSSLGRTVRYGKSGQEVHQQPEGKVMTVDFELDGFAITALNGGPQFKITPSISFFVTLESESEVDRIWNVLVDGGKVMMPLEKYAWSDKYGWLQDRYGVTWQIALGSLKDVDNQSIVLSFLFSDHQYGRGEEALNMYTSVFKNTSVTGILRYGAEEPPHREGTIMHAQFVIDGQVFTIMESPLEHNFSFTEAFSLVVFCETQSEIDYYWDKLTEGGSEQPCGWLKDRFGVSWQVVPKALTKMMADPDREKVERVTASFMQMKKLDLATLTRAYEGVETASHSL